MIYEVRNKLWHMISIAEIDSRTKKYIDTYGRWQTEDEIVNMFPAAKYPCSEEEPRYIPKVGDRFIIADTYEYTLECLHGSKYAFNRLGDNPDIEDLYNMNSLTFTRVK